MSERGEKPKRRGATKRPPRKPNSKRPRATGAELQARTARAGALLRLHKWGYKAADALCQEFPIGRRQAFKYIARAREAAAGEGGLDANAILGWQLERLQAVEATCFVRDKETGQLTLRHPALLLKCIKTAKHILPARLELSGEVRAVIKRDMSPDELAILERIMGEVVEPHAASGGKHADDSS